MLKKDDKRILYWLIDQYISKELDAWGFCQQYGECYNIEIDYDSLSQEEYDYFSKLNVVAVRFSKFEDDFKNYPGVYYTEQELDQKIIKTKEALKDCWITTDQ